jgi:hypothetical protein
MGKVDKFMLIREDDVLPEAFKWRVSSNLTTMESVCTNISSKLRNKLALEKAQGKSVNGITLPVTKTEFYDSLKSLPKTLGLVNAPGHFRSTKHFTINTPLGVTGYYNLVNTNRNYIVLDKMDNFLSSGYAYSIAYHDAYLDVSHEPLNISNDAIILINKDKYDEIIKNQDIVDTLNNKNVILYKGDEILAIDMVLASNGVLPSTVGFKYASYDNETRTIINNSIKNLANYYNLMYDKSHGGSKGHFTSYYDDLNNDYQNSINKFNKFMANRFKDYNFELCGIPRVDEESINKLIDSVSTDEILNAINEYNQEYFNNFKINKLKYLVDREQIDSNMHDLFIATDDMINEYFETDHDKDNNLDNLIKEYFQGSTVEEQVNAAYQINNLLKTSIQENVENYHKKL